MHDAMAQNAKGYEWNVNVEKHRTETLLKHQAQSIGCMFKC